MSLKVIARLVEKLLDKVHQDDEPRADMYLPDRLLSMAIVMGAAGLVLGAVNLVARKYVLLAVAVLLLVFGLAVFLAWKNQSIRIVDEERFIYKTFLGREKEMRFEDISALRKNRDSMTLFVGEEKVHIESQAVMTPRLAEKINQAFRQDEAHHG